MIQIASLVTEQGKERPTVRNVMTLQSCAPIVGAEVMSFDSEAALLKVSTSRSPTIPIPICQNDSGADLGRSRLKALRILCCLAVSECYALSWPMHTAAEIVQRWRDLVIETDPDIIIGYNICNFDLPYLIKRAETLKVEDFPYWGRNRKM